MAATKARSRLKKEIEKPIVASSRLKKKKIETEKFKIISQKLKLKEHLQFGTVLILSLISFYALYLLCQNFYPEQIQNFIIKNSYLPFFILFFLGSFFLFTFIFLNKKIGLLISFIISFSFYLKFIHVQLNLITILVVLVFSGSLAALLFPNFSRNKK